MALDVAQVARYQHPCQSRKWEDVVLEDGTVERRLVAWSAGMISSVPVERCWIAACIEPVDRLDPVGLCETHVSAGRLGLLGQTDEGDE